MDLIDVIYIIAVYPNKRYYIEESSSFVKEFRI